MRKYKPKQERVLMLIKFFMKYQWKEDDPPNIRKIVLLKYSTQQPPPSWGYETTRISLKDFSLIPKFPTKH